MNGIIPSDYGDNGPLGYYETVSLVLVCHIYMVIITSLHEGNDTPVLTETIGQILYNNRR